MNKNFTSKSLFHGINKAMFLSCTIYGSKAFF